eukprot:7493221-Ditylum_brightwellii.AAC.1
MRHECKGRFCDSNKVYFCCNKTKLHSFSSNSSKDLNIIIDKKITKAFSHQEKKEKAKLNKLKTLSNLSGSNGGDSNGKSKVSHTSNKGLDSK